MKKNITQAVILAAGMGVRLKELNRGIPKGFILLDDKPIIEHSIDALLACGIQDIIIVTGFMDQYYENLSDRYPQIQTVRNEKYSETGTMYSLWCARHLLNTDFILLESDLVFESKAISEILDFAFNDSILLSGKTEAGDEVYVGGDGDRVKQISKDKKTVQSIFGEFIGISKLSYVLYQDMILIAEKNFDSNPNFSYDMDCFVAVAENKPLKFLKIENLLWAEIDDVSQMKRAQNVWQQIKVQKA
ncbi:MAG: phosphocholine cytidylyltransferase family protein [Nitrospina sp.]|jgi:2-aminoethylphosphonate-pyruvate transaminase|nr:phosphocholine cytidylyltransferase family protein [Nitrospina sp.]MBT6716746.1 phosphocholine cytidylyltransferase family protein [Nitrospina sp.]